MFRSDSISDGNVEGVTQDVNPQKSPVASPGDPSPTAEAGVAEELVAGLDAIENQPLEDRAAAYVQLHDRLRDHLEGSDVARSTKE
jgi:hypothetical protein